MDHERVYWAIFFGLLLIGWFVVASPQPRPNFPGPQGPCCPRRAGWEKPGTYSRR